MKGRRVEFPDESIFIQAELILLIAVWERPLLLFSFCFSFFLVQRKNLWCSVVSSLPISNISYTTFPAIGLRDALKNGSFFFLRLSPFHFSVLLVRHFHRKVFISFLLVLWNMSLVDVLSSRDIISLIMKTIFAYNSIRRWSWCISFPAHLATRISKSNR